MIRRDLIAAAAGRASAPLVSRAQTKPTQSKIGYIHPRTIAPDHATLKFLRMALRRLGYVEGDTVLLRSAGGEIARIPALVNELVGLGAGVLIVVGAAAIRVAPKRPEPRRSSASIWKPTLCARVTRPVSPGRAAT